MLANNHSDISVKNKFKVNFHNQESQLVIITILPFIALAIWCMPGINVFCHKFDLWTFKILNQSLINQPFWQWFWGMLNHRREVWLNLVIANLINLWVVYKAPQYKISRYKLLVNLVYYWLFFEIFLLIEDWLFMNYLNISRLSPSLIIEPWVKLSKCLNNPMIIDASLTSFPSGHALAMVYWLCFTIKLSPKKIQIIASVICIFFVLPRLFSGAHWISDSLFSALLAFSAFNWASYIAKKINISI